MPTERLGLFAFKIWMLLYWKKGGVLLGVGPSFSQRLVASQRGSQLKPAHNSIAFLMMTPPKAFRPSKEFILAFKYTKTRAYRGFCRKLMRPGSEWLDGKFSAHLCALLGPSQLSAAISTNFADPDFVISSNSLFAIVYDSPFPISG